MTRAQKAAKANELRAQGLTYVQIAERMGVKFGTVSNWLYDPDGSKQQARKDRYAGICIGCGGVTDGSYGPAHASDLCQQCRNWSEEQIIAAIQAWAAEHGGIPPTCTEWRHADTDHPNATTVGKRIGWNEALLRAGFALKCDRRPETQQWLERELGRGTPVEEVADKLGVTPQAVRWRLAVRGLRLADVRAGAHSNGGESR